MKKIFIFLTIMFKANFAFGYITSDIPNGCDESYGNMYPVFTANQYTCDTGYYLPADAIACEECKPRGYTCAGGTYTYNKVDDQGIKLSGFVPTNGIADCDEFYGNMYPVFTANQYTCDTGYYLPAGQDWLTDNDGCRLCPADSYCVGGTYTFNETLTQGIVSCASGLFAPNGMWESAQCGRILHVGDGFVYLRATKKTSPALHLDLDHDGVADYFGNMTTLDVPMSRDTQRKLKVRYNNTTYSIYDDSVELNQYQN